MSHNKGETLTGLSGKRKSERYQPAGNYYGGDYEHSSYPMYDEYYDVPESDHPYYLQQKTQQAQYNSYMKKQDEPMYDEYADDEDYGFSYRY